MNSGCYGYDISRIFFSLKAMNLRGELKSFSKDEIKFIYRGNNLAKDLTILSVVLQGESGNKNQIKNKKISLISKKKESQPSKIKTCGSTFKNPENKKAWETRSNSIALESVRTICSCPITSLNFCGRHFRAETWKSIKKPLYKI